MKRSPSPDQRVIVVSHSHHVIVRSRWYPDLTVRSALPAFLPAGVLAAAHNAVRARSRRSVAAGAGQASTDWLIAMGVSVDEKTEPSRKLSRQQLRAQARDKHDAEGWIAALDIQDPSLQRAIRAAIGPRRITRALLEADIGVSLVGTPRT